MAKLVEAPPRFLPPEWRLSHKAQCSGAEAQRSQSERNVAETRRLLDEVEHATHKAQGDSSKRIEQRLEEIGFWRAQLREKLAQLAHETEALTDAEARLRKGTDGVREPLLIAQQCLLNRERRVGPDLVRDEAEKELQKEAEVLQGAATLMERTREQVLEQIRLNRSARYTVEKDLSDKEAALNIDTFCANLNNNTPDIRYARNVVKVEENSVSPEEWVDFSDANAAKADRQRNNSQALRALVDRILAQVAADERRQKAAADNALRDRVRETKEAKRALEEHLDKVMEQIGSQEKNIAGLRKAIADQEAPAKVAQTRLEARTHRPNVELCRDTAHLRLMREVNEIARNVCRLQEALAQAEQELKGLLRRQLSLEEEIQVKANSIYIDEVLCLQMRESIAINDF
ncbi:tektin-1 [Anolis carolinensis]|uniref:tektin-1 n=1 Tax=Anolis carolinensis TaxID=28377 RepID=UPI002F2B3C09